MAIKIDTLAQDHSKSSRMIRNYLEMVASVTGRDPIAKPGWVHDWAADEVSKVVSLGGPKSYERQYIQAQPEPQPEPVAPEPIATQAQPVATVIDVAAAPAPRPQLVWVNPNPTQQYTPAPVATYEATPIIGLGVPGAVMLANACQVDGLIQAADAMMTAIDQRFSIGDATLESQRIVTAERIELLRDKNAALKARARLYRETEIEASVKAQHDAQTVGKLQSEMVANGQAFGYQLQSQSC